MKKVNAIKRTKAKKEIQKYLIFLLKEYYNSIRKVMI